jgi:hypothetical protein
MLISVDLLHHRAYRARYFVLFEENNSFQEHIEEAMFESNRSPELECPLL